MTSLDFSEHMRVSVLVWRLAFRLVSVLPLAILIGLPPLPVFFVAGLLVASIVLLGREFAKLNREWRNDG